MYTYIYMCVHKAATAAVAWVATVAKNGGGTAPAAGHSPRHSSRANLLKTNLFHGDAKPDNTSRG